MLNVSHIRSRIHRYYGSLALWLYDQLVVGHRIRQQPASPGSESRSVSVAIAHFNSASQIHLPLFNILGDPRVSEIIIHDDGSCEDDFARLTLRVESLPKVKVFRRERNRGALRTKWDAVGHCQSEWVLLLDADNTAFRSYLEAIFAIESWCPSTIYCPSFAWPFFDFRVLAGRSLGFGDVRQHVVDGLLRRTYLLNDGNYFLPRQAYLDAVRPILDLPHPTPDVLEVNYVWLSLGNILTVLPHGATYCHRVSPGSYWNANPERSRGRLMELLAAIEAGEKWRPAS